jgi:hypothetical protein
MMKKSGQPGAGMDLSGPIIIHAASIGPSI